MVLGIGFIALALAISGLSLAFNFFSAPNSHLSRPPISAIQDAPQGSEPDSLAAVSSTLGDEAAAARKVISGPVQGSLAAVPPALPDEPVAVPRAPPSESEAVDPPTREEALAAVPTATPSESEAADPPAQRDEALAAPTATPSGPTLPKEAVSGILSSTISTHRAEQVAHDRSATSADPGRHPQRGTNLARIKHHTGTLLRARPAHAHPHSVLPERCGGTRLKLSCLPLRRVGARGPATHGPEGTRPSVPPWNGAPFALSPDFSRRMP
jgi:hypothetical protein